MRRCSRRTRYASGSTTQTVSPRGLSTRATPTAAASTAGARPSPAHRLGEELVQHLEGRLQLDRPHLEPRGDVAPGGRRDRRGEGRAVPEPGTRRAGVQPQPGGARGGPDGAELDGVVAIEDPHPAEPSLHRGGEADLAPGPRRVLAQLAKLAARPIGRRRRQVEAAGADLDRSEQEAVTGEGLVEAHRALLQRGEGHVPGGEADPGADGADVVEVVVEPLQLEQQRAGAPQLPGRGEAEDALAGLRVGDRVGDGAGPAGPLGEGQPIGQLPPLGGALEPAVLVEEAQVDEEDPLADDVEAEVPGLDHAGVDRPDGDLVHPLPLDRDGPARRVERVGDERAQRLVAVEPQAVEVVGLALVPLRRGDEVDDRRRLLAAEAGS